MNKFFKHYKTLLIGLLGMCFYTSSAYARTWRVNNTLGVAADHTTVMAAVNAASAGDIIYVEPSPTEYAGAITISKKLTLIGSGAFLDSNTGLQVHLSESYISSSITFNVGSDGSKLYGLSTGAVVINANVSNIDIVRNKMTSITMSGAGTGILVAENFLTGALKTDDRTNVLIRNNIIRSTLSTSGLGVVTIENNTIVVPPANNALSLAGASRVVVNNNIISNGTSGNLAVNGGGSASFSNNISSDNSIPVNVGNTNNQANIPLANVIMNVTLTTDADARLKPNSPAIDAGLYNNTNAGDDIGAFNNGTNRPSFVLGLIPPYPTIYKLTTAGTVNTAEMSVTISTRANN